MSFSGLTYILLGKPGEYKGLKGQSRIPIDDLILKKRLCRNQYLMAFQIPSVGTNVYLNRISHVGEFFCVYVHFSLVYYQSKS